MGCECHKNPLFERGESGVGGEFCESLIKKIPCPSGIAPVDLVMDDKGAPHMVGGSTSLIRASKDCNMSSRRYLALGFAMN